LSNKRTKFVPEFVAPAALNASLPESSFPALFRNLTAGTLSTVPGINVTIINAVAAANSRAGAEAFKYVWYAVIAFCCLAVEATFMTISYGEYLNDDVARKMHGRTVGVAESGIEEPMVNLEMTTRG
jgi:hypothetical protein